MFCNVRVSHISQSGDSRNVLVSEAVLESSYSRPVLCSIVAAGLMYHLFCGSLSRREYKHALIKLKELFNLRKKR